ncbi:LTA synthase family protein [Lysobacter capsici]|uniref:LTA synthase family protein n=1 Tax=Lysobacter capsici TaxID=435897 RepID=UPI000BBA7802|nr:LTA synthase family protein [Lysobacter capsici]ATE70809.1 sulfatase [Lysobacter capsici]
MVVRVIKDCLARVAPFLCCFGIGLAVLSLSRLGLALWQADAVNDADAWSRVLLQGIRVDIASLCMLLSIATALYLLLPARVAGHALVRTVMAAWLALSLTVLVMLELATPTFMQEYGLRPNRLFLEYLIYPREVVSTLAKGHLVSAALALVLSAIAGWLAWRFANRMLRASAQASPHWSARLPFAALLICLAALGIRSTLGHRPMNPAMMAFSSNATVNTLPLNSFYTLAYAARDWLRHDPGARIYGGAADAEVVKAVTDGMQLPPEAFIDPKLPTLARRPPAYTGKPRNLVIVLEESLGAQFVGHLGGRPLTPNIDRLAAQGWAFDRLYATGTRSVRGIEAVLTGFTPTPSQAVVKQPLSQQNFFTLAEVLRRRGYDTTFYYGGESHFDNMRGFFLSNGFRRVIEQKDYPHPAFTGSWGVSDEDLFDRAHQEFARMHQAGKPFFGFVFSSSNHDPFEFPSNRIELYEQPQATRNNAAKYADYAVGEFFRKAMASDYWKDTIFLIVADHDSRAFGRDLVPIDNFHIPGVILGGAIAPALDKRIVSQIDLPPTLLSLIGIDTPTPMSGHDLNQRDRFQPGRAMMQYDKNFAWMSGKDVIVLQPGQPPRQFTYTPGERMTPAASVDPELAKTAHLQALWGSLAYERGWHRLPAKSD